MRHPLFHFFSSFSLFGRFFFDFFYFAGQAAHFLFFIDLFDYTIIFCFYGFNIFLSLPRLLSSFPSFWLTFLFFCKQSHFFSFINIFYSFSPFLSLIAISHHFLAFHCLSLPFLFFSPMSILHFPLFSRFLPFLNSFLSFLLFPPLPSFYTLFLPFFLDHPSFFHFYLCHFPRLIFHVSRFSKCFT